VAGEVGLFMDGGRVVVSDCLRRALGVMMEYDLSGAFTDSTTYRNLTRAGILALYYRLEPIVNRSETSECRILALSRAPERPDPEVLRPLTRVNERR